MKHIPRDRLFIFAGSVGIVGTLVFLAITVLSLGPAKSETQKLEQLVNPVSYENAEVETVLQDIVNSSSQPIQIRLCKQLAKKRITLKLRRPLELKTVLKAISLQLDCDFYLYIGMHAETAFPTFRCLSDNRDLMIIDKKKI